MKRIKEMKKNQKGFTLVELIVVLVILAILAAMLVPALLGYIDRAKQGKYSEEIHSIYTAVQVVNDERYAAGQAAVTAFSSLDSGTGVMKKNEKQEINDMVSPAVVSDFTATQKGTSGKDSYTITGFSNLVFTSQDTNTVYATMTDSTVSVTYVEDKDGNVVSGTKPSTP